MSTRFAPPMARLIEELRKLPGVGTKTAQRFAFHILRSSDRDADALASAIHALKQALRLCSVCNNVTDVDPCHFCSNPARNHRVICVVEEPTNIALVERTRTFNGVFHVLHGTLSPVNAIGPEQLRLANLWPRLAFAAEIPSSEELSRPGGPGEVGQLGELILATSPTVEGEATARYIGDEARHLYPNLPVTRIATGIPAGSDIEYADEITMTRALENRRAV